MHIQTETNESLFNDLYRILEFHMIGVSKKNMLFILCTTQLIRFNIHPKIDRKLLMAVRNALICLIRL
jgi:hypothetical protein